MPRNRQIDWHPYYTVFINRLSKFCEMEEIEIEKELVFYSHKFELEVRMALSITDRNIYPSDVLKISELDLAEMRFDVRDCDVMCRFENLESLYINFGYKDISFLSSLKKLRLLNLESYCSTFDFKYLSELKGLNELFISGGDYSGMRLDNLEAISGIDGLEYLGLHEFGYVDLRPLKKMPQLKDFLCGWADEVINYDSIGDLKSLKTLTLIDLKLDDIDFLRNMPVDMSLELCGINFTKEIDIGIFDRFSKKDLSEIIINNERVFFEGDYI